MSMFIARTISKACLVWMLFYLVFGGSRTGKDFFGDFVSNQIDDPKGGVPIIMLVYPVLIAASLASLLVTRPTRRKQRQGLTYGPPPPATSMLRRIGLRLRLRLPLPLPLPLRFPMGRDGNSNFDLYAVLCLVLPCTIYTVSGIQRHLSHLEIEPPLSLWTMHHYFRQNFQDNQVVGAILKAVGNTLGMTVMVALPFLLIPVSKHGPLLKLFGWSPAGAVRLHLWCGRVMIFGSILHGAAHLLRWKYVLGEEVRSVLIPPRQCWSWSGKQRHGGDISITLTTCHNVNTSCTCYNHFLYWTGTLALVALVFILVSSCAWVRRSSYRLFYFCHILLAPIFILMTLLHFDLGILYVSPSILYYLATSLPVWQERSRQMGIQVDKVEILGTVNDMNGLCVSLTIAATPDTVRVYRPGMYTNMHVPSLSKVAHPFTLNRVLGRDDQLRIIFRVTGSFTTALAEQLQQGIIPRMYLDDFHGCPKRLELVSIQHDATVLVAGGIGVTPFLSLLTDLVTSNDDHDDHAPEHSEKSPCNQPSQVAFHWMCRDISLFAYVQREYLTPMQEVASTHGCDLNLHLYKTGRPTTSESPCIQTIMVNQCDGRIPFHLSRFAPARRVFGNLWTFATHSIILWAGVAISWHLYANVQTETEVWTRAAAPMVILLLATAVSYVSVILRPSTRSLFLNNTKWKRPSCDDPERKQLLSPTLLLASTTSSYSSDQECPRILQQLEHTGRPISMARVLEPCLAAMQPAVMVCGPMSLSQDVQHVLQAQRQAAIADQALSHTTPLYEEVFLI